MAFNRDKALAAAAKFAAKGQHDRSAKEYAAVVEADPSDIRSWLLLADALRLMGDTAGASERFLYVGQHYTEAGEHQKALAVYRQVLQIDSGRLDVQSRVAGLYKELGRTQDAIATYEFVAQAYFQSGQIAEGLEGFRMVAELDPGAVGKRLRLAELYSREGMVPQAVEHFRNAADKLFADRRIDDYIRVAERLIYHKEDDLPVLRSLARIYLSQNENRRALVKLNALLRSAPADPEGLELLADTFVALGKQDKSVSVLQELAKEQRKGNRQAKMLAARVLRKAIALGPENADDLKKIAADIDAEIAALPVDPHEREEDVGLDIDVVEDEGAGDLELEVEVEEVPSRPFAGVGANLAPSAAEEPEDNVGDVDKLLLEVRVYIKYKMFEHALGHLDSVFVRDGSNVAALELQASILEALQRNDDAADTYVRLAQLVAGRDPKLARDHVERALKLAPNHTRAEMVLAALEASGGQVDEASPLVRGTQAERLVGDAETAAAGLPSDSASNLSAQSGTKAQVTETSTAAAEPEAAEPEAEAEPEAAPEPEAAAEPEAAEPPAPAREDSGLKSLALGLAAPPSRDEGELAVAGRTPLPGPLPGRSTEKTPLPRTGSEKTPLPTFKPPVRAKQTGAEQAVPQDMPAETPAREPETPARADAAAEPSTSRKPPRRPPVKPTAKPTLAKPASRPTPRAEEVEELEAEEVEELEADEIVETVPTPAPPKKTPPKRPPQRPSRGPPASKSKAAAEPTTETSVATEAVRTDSEADAKVEAGRTGREVDEKPADAEAVQTATEASAKSPVAGEAVRTDSETDAKPEVSGEAVRTDSETQPEISGEAARTDSETDAKSPTDGEAVRTDRETDAKPLTDRETDAKSPTDEEAVRTDSEADAKSPAEGEIAAKSPTDGERTDSELDAKPLTDGEAVRTDSEADAKSPTDGEAVRTDSELDAKPLTDGEAVRTDSEIDAKPATETEARGDAKPETEAGEDATPTTETKTATGEPAAAAEATHAQDLGAPRSDSEAAAQAEATAAQTEAAAAQAEATAAQPEATAAQTEATDAQTEATAAQVADASDQATEAIGADSEPEATEDAPKAAEAVEPVSADSQSEPASSEAPTAAAIAEADAAEPAPEWPDLTDEIEELRFFISGRFEDDAQFTYLDLHRRFPDHPALAEFADRFATGAKLESAAAPVMIEDTPPPVSPVAPVAPMATVLRLEDEDDDDDFLSSIFDEPSPVADRKKSPQRAVATLTEQADAQTYFDLGMAYHEMGLIDDALAQFGLAAADGRWQSRAKVMIADLRILRGEPSVAVAALRDAIASATDEDERDAAHYRLAEVYTTLGDAEAASAALREVSPGYRDRDALLAEHDDS